uniref:SAM-dependent MTase RsmB/NOP-type domain-containing protein n=1 Tax=Sus scrofa TaxID=9823 RepID=A0A8D0IRA7_PIG
MGLFLASPKIYRRSFLELGFKTLKKRLLPNCYSGFRAGEPPFLPESFDGILLDAPCSGMGQRPYMACTWTLKEMIPYQPLQRKLFTVVSDDTLLWEKGDFYYFDI